MIGVEKAANGRNVPGKSEQMIGADRRRMTITELDRLRHYLLSKSEIPPLGKMIGER
jgi:hypothetical protein